MRSRGPVPADVRAWDYDPPAGRPTSRAFGRPSAPVAGPQLTSQLTRVATLPPYWLEKPRSGTDVYFRETAVLAAVVGTTVDFPAAGPIQIPATNFGVVSFLSVFVDAPLTTIDVIWTLLVNGGPVPGWDTLGTFPRTANNISITFPGTVHLPLGARVSVRVTNRAATGPWTIGTEVSGWHWPKIDEDQAFGFSDR